MEVLREAPKTSSFIPLIEHQSTTPASFYAGPPVLHYYSDRSKLIVLEHEIASAPAFAPLLEGTQAAQPSHANGDGANGESETGTERVVEDLDVWVTSDKLFLFSNAASVGLSIPYPSISLHAIQSLPRPSAIEQRGLYMQLLSTPAEDISGEDTEPESISVTIIPTASAAPEIASADPAGEESIENEDKPEQTPVVAMFNALSNCSNLHPDPVEPGDEEDDDDEDGVGAGRGASRLFQAGLALPGASDGGLPPALPGSGGWITAENMHEYFDADGNWIGGGDQEGDGEEDDDTGDGDGDALGPGAGTVRARDDAEHDDNGTEETDETKWRRTA